MLLKAFIDLGIFTQKEFAKLIGVNPCSVSNYICNKRTPTLEIALRIQKATKGKVTVEELLEGKNERKRSYT